MINFRVIFRKIESSSCSFATFEEMVNSVLNINEDVSSESDSDAEEMFMTSLNDTSSSMLSAREQVRQLEEEKICKICGNNEVQVVFLPCAHLATCTECSAAARQCPICKIAISDKIRTFTP